MPFCGEYSLTLFVQVVNYLCKIIISFVRVIRLCLMGTSGFIMFHSVRSYLERIGEKLRLKDVKIEDTENCFQNHRIFC